MDTETTTPRVRLVRPEEACQHIVNNGRGTVFGCTRKPHPDQPNVHVMVAVPRGLR